MVGRTLSHYKVLEEISRGGMGIVYKALDLKLHREVALKVLPPELVSDPDRKRRFLQEAQAAAVLKHPNIAVIHEIDEADGVDFITMELIEGEKLSSILERGRLSVSRTLELAIEIAQGLGRAHDKGIVHRDLKPANVMVTEDGHAKIIDFGLAKLLEPAGGEASALETAIREQTRSDVLMGTVSYMSPEQSMGQALDGRTDLFSLGVMLYEMTTGTKPFSGETPPAIFDAILHKAPISPRDLNNEVPPSLERVIRKLLEKDRRLRFQTASALIEALTNVERDTTVVPLESVLRGLKKPRWMVAAALAVALLSLILVRAARHSERVRWAREEAIPEVARLVDDEEFARAFELAAEAETYVPEDPMLARLWSDLSTSVSVFTVPPGADVYLNDYKNPVDQWQYLGRTPVENVPIPRGSFRWKLVKEGYHIAEPAFEPFASADVTLRRTLEKEGEVPPGMVRVEERGYFPDFVGLSHLQRLEIDAFLLDKYEVTNEDFKAFVDAGGYRNQRYWKHEFIQEGRSLTWEEAMAELVDATGRPGPSTWELGDFPDGEDDHPVTGVSWYEAAAYAEFAEKTLPTLYHWGRAAGTWLADQIVVVSNFDGLGPAPVGTYLGTSIEGTYDMAGNVKEWSWNQSGDKRFILGGAWNEPAYMFNHPDAQDPFRRLPTYGFRCMKLLTGDEIPESMARPFVAAPMRDFREVEPISDEVFDIYKRVFAYDATDLAPVVESIDESAEHWRSEVVSFHAAYGNERVTAYLYVPKDFPPPYQPVIYFPGADAIHLRSSGQFRVGPSGHMGSEGGLGGIDFLLKSGRAVIYPIYKGTYERGDELKSNYPDRTSFYRDHLSMWVKDLARSIDYLKTRTEFNDRFVLYGYSWGAQLGAIIPAVEDRLVAAVLVSGGFKQQEALPEADQVTYAPRVRIPTLMLNGRYDFFFPLEESQIPMFELLGTPREAKRHVVFETAHTIPRREGIKEILDWLDTHVGPVP